MKWGSRAKLRRGCCFLIEGEWSKRDRRTGFSRMPKLNAHASFSSARPVTPPTAGAKNNEAKGRPHGSELSSFARRTEAGRALQPRRRGRSIRIVTGQLATDPDDDSLLVPPGIEAQTRKVMDNLSCV